MRTVDLTHKLSINHAARSADALEAKLRRDPSLAFLIRFDNERRDPIKVFASRWFPALHLPIHSRVVSAILVHAIGDGVVVHLLDGAKDASTLDGA